MVLPMALGVGMIAEYLKERLFLPPTKMRTEYLN